MQFVKLVVMLYLLALSTLALSAQTGGGRGLLDPSLISTALAPLVWSGYEGTPLLMGGPVPGAIEALQRGQSSASSQPAELAASKAVGAQRRGAGVLQRLRGGGGGGAAGAPPSSITTNYHQRQQMMDMLSPMMWSTLDASPAFLGGLPGMKLPNVAAPASNPAEAAGKHQAGALNMGLRGGGGDDDADADAFGSLNEESVSSFLNSGRVERRADSEAAGNLGLRGGGGGDVDAHEGTPLSEDAMSSYLNSGNPSMLEKRAETGNLGLRGGGGDDLGEGAPALEDTMSAYVHSGDPSALE